jgi:hypothetical protein
MLAVVESCSSASSFEEPPQGRARFWWLSSEESAGDNCVIFPYILRSKYTIDAAIQILFALKETLCTCVTSEPYEFERSELFDCTTYSNTAR